jgi:hypothetical protein
MLLIPYPDTVLMGQQGMERSTLSEASSPDVRAVERARRSREIRTQAGRGRRLDLLLDQPATSALLQLSRAWNETLTGTIGRSLVQSKVRRQEQRKLTAPDKDANDPSDESVRRDVQAIRTRAWYQAVRLGLKVENSAQLERKLSRQRKVVVAEGSWARYERGERHPSESVRNIADAAVPGSAETYETGPYRSMLWVALLSKKPDQLWDIVFRHYPAISELRSAMRPFGDMVQALRDIGRTAPYREHDPEWPLKPARLALPDLRSSDYLGSPNEYCMVASLVALYRLSGLLYQPEHAQDLYELLHHHVLGNLRGVHGQLQIQNALDAVIQELNQGMPRGTRKRHRQRVFADARDSLAGS